MSWKQYGGQRNFENAPNIKTNTLTAQSVYLQSGFVGDIDICGSIIASGDLSIAGNIYIGGTTAMNEVAVGNLVVTNSALFQGFVTFANDFATQGNLNVGENLSATGDVNVGKYLKFFDGKNPLNGDPSVFTLYGNTNGIGINQNVPKYTLDICGNTVSGLSVYTSQNSLHSVLGQTANQYGVALDVYNGYSGFEFYADNPIASGMQDGRIYAAPGGVLVIDVSKNLSISCGATLSARADEYEADVEYGHITNEAFTVYDNSSSAYFYKVYKSTGYSGNAVALVAADNASNTFMSISTPSGTGSLYGGGAYPVDASRSMGTIGVIDPSGGINLSQLTVEGKDPQKYKTITGINTLKPRVDNYVLDVNGPIHIDNSDIQEIANIPFEIYSVSSSNNSVLTVGSSIDINGSFNYPDTNNVQKSGFRQRIYYSSDYGSSWNYKTIYPSDINVSYLSTLEPGYAIGTTGQSLFSGQIYNNSLGFVSGNLNALYYTYNGGSAWAKINTNFIRVTPQAVTYRNILVGSVSTGIAKIFFSVDASSSLCCFSQQTTDFNGSSITSTVFTYDSNISNITTIASNPTYVFVGGNTISRFQQNLLGTDVVVNPTMTRVGLSDFSFNSIVTYGDSMVIAVGNSIISSSLNNGATWTDYSTSVNFKDVYIYDANRAIAVGIGGNVFCTYTSGNTWSVMPDNLLNSSGKQNLLTDGANQLNQITSPNPNTAIISNVLSTYRFSSVFGNSVLYNLFSPNFAGTSSMSVLDISGNMRIGGDININDGGALKTNQSVFSLLNTGVQTVKFAGDASSVLIGNVEASTTTIGSALDVNGISIFRNAALPSSGEDSFGSLNNGGALRVTGGAAVSKNMFVGGNITANIVNAQTRLYAGNLGIQTTTPQFPLDVSGVLRTTGNLLVNKYFGAGLGAGTTWDPSYTVDVLGNINVRGGNLIARYDASFNGNLVVDGNTFLNGILYANNAIMVDSTHSIIASKMTNNSSTPLNIDVVGSVLNLTNSSPSIATNIINIGSFNPGASKCVINLGSQFDTVNLPPGTSQQISTTTSFAGAYQVLNAGSAPGNATSAGSGFWIHDNSYNTPIANNGDHAGWLTQSNDLQSFVFAATSIGTLDGTPQSDGYILSQQRRIKFATNSLYIDNPVTTKQQLVVLQNTSDYTRTPNYGLNDSDYVVTTTPVDVSNIMIKDYDMNYNVNGFYTQSLKSDLRVLGNILATGNTTVGGVANLNGNVIMNITYGNVSQITFANPDSATNYGQVAFYKSVVGTPYNNYFNYSSNNNSTLVITSQSDTFGPNSDNVLIRPAGMVIIDASSNAGTNIGRTIIQPFGGNVGIGTVDPAYSFDVVGSGRFYGQFINTNYDTARFSSNYASVFSDYSNALSVVGQPNLSWQDVAISYNGQYQVAYTNRWDGSGNLFVSSDFGASWTNARLNMPTGNTNIYQAVPNMGGASFDSGNGSWIYNFGLRDLYLNQAGSTLGNIFISRASPLNIQMGQYDISASSYPSSTNYPYYAFDNTGSYWISNISNSYDQFTGIYSGSTTTTISNEKSGFSIGAPVKGEWIQVKLPYSFVISSYTFNTTVSNGFSFPGNIYLAGSNDGKTWGNITYNTNIPKQSPGISTTIGFSSNVPYNYYRFIVPGIVGGGTLTTPTGAEFGNINLVGNVVNPTGSFGATIAVSAAGQYSLIANKSYNMNSGNLFINTTPYNLLNYTDTNFRASGQGVWQSVAISQDGLTQVATTCGSYSKGNIFISRNAGQTWSVPTSGHQVDNGWLSISMSSDGKYMTALQAGNAYSTRGGIYTSSDYGGNWVSSTALYKPGTTSATVSGIYSYVPHNLGFLNLGMSDFDKVVCVSTNGRYQTILATGSTGSGTDDRANVWISSDYGVSWRDTAYSPGFGGDAIMTSITMIGTGQTQALTFVNRGSNTVFGNTAVSSDYGVSWMDMNNAKGGNLYCSKIAGTVAGKYVLSGMKKYDPLIYGNVITNSTFLQNTGNLLLNNVSSYGNTFSTQYFGSAHTNDVHQTHGIRMTVPNDNNATLMMGYDPAWDATYINSGDEYGLNDLCLMTTGGTVSVGKIDANIAYALDISGGMNVASNASNPNALCVSSNGYLGIGTSSPSYNLDLNGNLRIPNGAIMYANNSSGVAESFLFARDNTNTTLMNIGSAGLNIRNNAGSISALFVNSSNQVGINTVSPAYTLDLNGNLRIPNSAIIYTNNSSGVAESFLWPRFSDNVTYMNFGSSGFNLRNNSSVSALFINSSNQVGIGTTSPAYNLDLQTGTGRMNKLLIGSTSTAAGISGSTNVGTDVVIFANNGTIYFKPKGESDATNQGYYDNTGKMNAVSFNATSDYRMKRNVVDLPTEYTVDKLRPVEYDLSASGLHDMGFIAHEVQDVYPFLVSGEKDGEQFQSLNYNGFIALLTKEIQELKKENLQKSSEILELKKAVADILARI